MVEKTPLSAEVLAENFADLHPPYSRDEAVVEASRCLFCYDAPCTRACPTGIDVPRFIRQIMHDNPAGAAETILEENILGGSCARACPTEVLCEGACVDQTLLHEPVRIGRLQRYATDHALERGLQFFEAGPETGKRVAVVGAGPAGLSCAHALRRNGHAVTVFEAREVVGGLNTLGIAAYKISTEFALREMDQLLAIGIEVRLGNYIRPEDLPRLYAGYDAVFLALGLGQTRPLELPGEEVEGVWEALDFIFQTHTGPLTECVVGKNVVVIGAGNTAIDVATEAVRLGAETVTIAYRRTAAEMSAFRYEYELALSDGVRFLWQVEPRAFITTEDRLTGILLQRVLRARGSDAPLPPLEPPYELPCDMVVKALGQAPLTDWFKGVAFPMADDRRLKADPATGATDLPDVFAGGDCTNGGGEIVDAVQAGKLAARAIHAYLTSDVEQS